MKNITNLKHLLIITLSSFLLVVVGLMITFSLCLK